MSESTKKTTTIQRGVMGFSAYPLLDPVTAWKNAVALERPGLRTMYIHIPYCRSRCPFCPFFLELGDNTQLHEYVTLLVKELKNSSPELGHDPINAVYFGGGTPSDMTGEDFSLLLETLHRHYRLANDCEITVEGRIDGFDDDKLDRIFAGGVNRISIGIQCFDTQKRRQLGRFTPRAEIIDSLNRLTARNQAAIVIDLMYGLPGETPESWQRELDTVRRETDIAGLDLYRLRVNPHLPLAGLLAAGTLPPVPDEAQSYAHFQQGVSAMLEVGATRLSAMHFAFSTRERNLNNDISSYKNTCLPFGMKAVGRLNGYRFIQTRDLKEYRKMVKVGLKPVVEAGEFPPDFAACAELSGEMYRGMRLNPEQIARKAPGKESKVKNILEHRIKSWQEKGYFLPEEQGWFPMTDYAKFSHREMATDLMEAIASEWN